MNADRCPVCNSPEEDGCGCNPLWCPVCGQVVDWFGEESGSNPCAHVVAWGVVGNDDTQWCDEKAEALFREYAAKNGSWSDEATLEKFAETTGLQYLMHDDGGPHGFGMASYFVFPAQPESKKTKSRKAAKKPKATRRRRTPKTR